MRNLTPQLLLEYGFVHMRKASDTPGNIYTKGNFTVTENNGRYFWSTSETQIPQELQTIEGLRMAYEGKMGSKLMRTYKSEMRT